MSGRVGDLSPKQAEALEQVSAHLFIIIHQLSAIVKNYLFCQVMKNEKKKQKNKKHNNTTQ